MLITGYKFFYWMIVGTIFGLNLTFIIPALIVYIFPETDISQKRKVIILILLAILISITICYLLALPFVFS